MESETVAEWHEALVPRKAWHFVARKKCVGTVVQAPEGFGIRLACRKMDAQAPFCSKFPGLVSVPQQNLPHLLGERGRDLLPIPDIPPHDPI